MSTLFYVSYAALWLLLLTIGVLLLLLYRHFGVMALGTLDGVQRDGLPIGALAPSIGGVTPDGADRGWEPRPGRPELLLFVSPDCKPCETLLPVVNRLAAAGGHGVGITAFVPGPRESVARLAARYAPAYPCLAEDGSGAFGRFRVRVTPFGFVVGGDGRVLAKGLVSDAGRLRDLLRSAGVDEAAAAVEASAAATTVAPPGQPLTLVGRGVGATTASTNGAGGKNGNGTGSGTGVGR